MSARRKGIAQHHPNPERWMVSYADFITLLFAVFVVLFASGQSNKNTPQQIAAAVTHALQNGSIREAIRVLRSDTPKAALPPEAQLSSSLESLNKQLAQEMTAGKVDVRLDPRGLIVSLRQAAFFPSGQATIEPSTYPIIDKLAAVLAAIPNKVRLEGHTDAIPINNSRYSSNWELSAARSIAMLEILANRNHINRDRLSIAGYAETAPVSSNDDAEGRAKNRRVDVVILNTPEAGGAGN
jgi:chemotaxis protein MotB